MWESAERGRAAPAAQTAPTTRRAIRVSGILRAEVFCESLQTKVQDGKAVPSEEAAVVREISSRAFSYTVEEDDIII